MEFTDYDTRLAAYALIVDDERRVLLALWNEAAEHRWTLPGGGVELAETPEQGAVREVREESGYDVALSDLLGVDSWVIGAERRFSGRGRALRNVRVVYTARVTGGALAREVGGTTDEARWWPLDEVPGLPRVGLVDVALGWWRAV